MASPVSSSPTRKKLFASAAKMREPAAFHVAGGASGAAGRGPLLCYSQLIAFKSGLDLKEVGAQLQARKEELQTKMAKAS